MKQYGLPSFPPLAGIFTDNDGFAQQAQDTVIALLERGDCDLFGVVTCGVGGGYLVPLDEDFECHPVEKFVFLFKPARDYENAAAVVAATWGVDCAEMEADWNAAIGTADAVRLEEIPVCYLFESRAEAETWLSELNQ